MCCIPFAAISQRGVNRTNSVTDHFLPNWLGFAAVWRPVLTPDERVAIKSEIVDSLGDIQKDFGWVKILRFAGAHEFQRCWVVSRSKDPVCHHVGEMGNDVRVFTR